VETGGPDAPRAEAPGAAATSPAAPESSPAASSGPIPAEASPAGGAAADSLVPDEILAARRARRARRAAARAQEAAQGAAPPAPPARETALPGPAAEAAAPDPAAPAGKPNYAAMRAERAKAAAEARAAEREAEAALDPEAEGLDAAPRGRRGRGRRAADPVLEPEEIARTVAAQPEVRPAKPKRRHLVLALSFLVAVILPALAVAGYLYTRAADQYHSRVAFSIRSEDAGAASGILGALTSIGSGSASDTDILFEFIRSQRIVEEINRDLDLRAIYNRAPGDVWFALGADPSIEALHAQWLRMVDVSIGSAGIIEVTAKAFAPEDAKRIAEAILTHSSALVNRLSEQARSDAIKFAAGELGRAEGDLREMRQKMNDFRREHRLVDPSADAAGQAGLLNAMQSQLAQALVDRDMLRTYAADSDQRMIQANRRIDAITERIDAERGTLGVTGVAGSLPDVLSAYEERRVDLEFASTAYTQALAGLAAARAEAGRQSRYLAPHIQPTLAETSLYPRREMLSGLTLLFLTLGWGVLMLIYYNVRDNR
jgi:capsular polysaccharide transport system permease protein